MLSLFFFFDFFLLFYFFLKLKKNFFFNIFVLTQRVFRTFCFNFAIFIWFKAFFVFYSNFLFQIKKKKF